MLDKNYYLINKYIDIVIKDNDKFSRNILNTDCSKIASLYN